jgi:hypothetical protein
VSLCGDSRYFVGFHEKSMCFLKQKAVGCGFFLRASTRPFRSPYCSGLLYECVYATPSFLHVASTCRKRASGMSLLGLPRVSVSPFLEGPVSSPDPVQVGDSSGSHGALYSLQAPGSTLQRLDVHLRLRPRGFSSLDPRAPYATSSLSRLRSTSM